MVARGEGQNEGWRSMLGALAFSIKNAFKDPTVKPPHLAQVPQLEIPYKRQSTRHPTTPQRKEGLNILYRASALLWLLLCHRYPSLKFSTTSRYVEESLASYRRKLLHLAELPHCLDHHQLTRLGWVKEKHWSYAAFMATMSSLPLLYKACSKEEVLEAILAKTSVGTSAKLLDNLNDEIHEPSQALSSLRNMLSAYVEGGYRSREGKDPVVAGAENSAFEMGKWVFKTLSSCQFSAPRMYEAYVKDATKLFHGQLNSLVHKVRGRRELPSLVEYLRSISEKSIGDLWLDVDLCFLERGLKGFDKDELRAIRLLKAGNSLIFKSSLIYDDVQDLYEDLRTNSINSAVLLALERGVISHRDIDLLNQSRFKGDILWLADTLGQSDILLDTIRLADMIFLAGVDVVASIENPLRGTFDKRGLIQGYRLVRLFNLRKLLIRNRDYETAKLFFSSLGNLVELKEGIPDDIARLRRYLLCDVLGS